MKISELSRVTGVEVETIRDGSDDVDAPVAAKGEARAGHTGNPR